MKQSDIFSIILVAGIGVFAAFLLCNSLMGDPNSASTEFEALSEVIKSDLVTPDAEIFNSAAINPTIEVYVGDCEDVDRNGILDEAELAACSTVEVEQTDEGAEESGGE